MIGRLRGNVVSKASNKVVVDVNGVGYELLVSKSTLQKMTSSAVELKVYTHVREDQLQLYGFLTAAEKEVFQLLISVSGIGPKVALTVLSETSPQELTHIVISSNVQKLKTVPGIGKKTAERLVLELKSKMKSWSTLGSDSEVQGASSPLADLSSALLNLGYRQNEVDRAVSQVRMPQSGDVAFEEILRKALQYLRG